MHISLHTSTSRKTIFWWTVQSTASPSSGTIRITREGDKDIWRSNHFTSRTFYQKLVHLAKCEGRFVFLQNDDGRERLGWDSLPSPRVDLRRVPCRISWGGYFGKCRVFFSSKVGLIFSFLSSRKVEVALDPSWDFDIHQTCSSFSEICRNRKIGPYFRKMQCAGETSS